MIIRYIGFPSILLDNEITYFHYLRGIIEAIDINASLQVVRKEDGINLRIAPSDPYLINNLVKEINRINRQFGIHTEYSKSIKTLAVINFSISFI